MPLLSLPDETLLQIARLVPTEAPGVYNLAKTCTRLDRVCGTLIWTKYKLVIRDEKETRKSSAPHGPVAQWSARWNKRIAHFLHKAPVVRELVIEDDSDIWRARQGEWPDSMAFGQDLMDAAMPAIQACTRLTSLRLVSTSSSAFWPSQLWSLILRRFTMLRTLSLNANFVDVPCPEPNSPPKTLRSMQLHWCKGLVNDFLSHEMILADNIRFRSWVYPGHPPTDLVFTPQPQLAKHLKQLDVEITDGYLPGPAFDVVPIPHAVISIRILVCNAYKFQYTRHWHRIKPHIACLVTQDIALFNVRRDHDIFIDRPSLIAQPNYRGDHQDHLSSAEFDEMERKARSAYCRDQWQSQIMYDERP